MAAMVMLAASILPAGGVLAADSEDACIERGIEYGKQKMYDEAIGEFNKAIAANPKSGKAYHFRATAFAYKGDLDAAVADWDRSIASDRTQCIVYFSRGLALYKRGSPDKAIADWTRSIKLDPKYVEAYYRRGLAYYDKDDFNKAIADFSKAITLDPDNARKYYLKRALAYSSKGNYAKSWKDVHAIEELGDEPGPEFNDLVETLKIGSGREK